jgi:HEPN domain-containing protein
MNPLTLEWVDKAEGDFATARRELRARKAPNYDAVCFHAQQMAEKYLKAILQENGLSIPKTHSLADILAICIKIDASIQMIQMDLNVLEGYAVNFRYPGQSADKLDAKSAEIVRICVRSKLEL